MIDPTTVVELVVRGEAEGQQVYNVHHLMLTPGLTDPINYQVWDLAYLVGEFRARWRTYILPNLSASYFVNEYYAVEILGRDPYTGPGTRVASLRFGLEHVVKGVVGTDKGGVAIADSDYLPTFNAVSVAFKCTKRSRWFRGGKRFAPIPEEHTTGNDLKTANKENWDDAAGMYLGFLSGAAIASGANASYGVFSKTLAYRNNLTGYTQDLRNYFDVIKSRRVAWQLSTQDSRKEPRSG